MTVRVAYLLTFGAVLAKFLARGKMYDVTCTSAMICLICALDICPLSLHGPQKLWLFHFELVFPSYFLRKGAPL